MIDAIVVQALPMNCLQIQSCQILPAASINSVLVEVQSFCARYVARKKQKHVLSDIWMQLPPSGPRSALRKPSTATIKL